jgi:RNA polymerase sigma factor (sigma-70 family)
MNMRSSDAVESASEDVQNQGSSVPRQTETPSPVTRARSAAGWRLRRSSQGTGREFDHLTDEALIALVGRGDDEAFGALYDRFSRIAYGLALRILRDRALAEDAVQDGFLAIWRSAPSFSAERSKPSTWMLTLVHRRAVDLVRREERRRTEPMDDVEHPAGGATDAEAALRSQRRLVQEALRSLPDEQREALELAYYGGFSQSELAERLGQPLGTIKSRMFTGLARLRDLLAEAGLEAELGR